MKLIPAGDDAEVVGIQDDLYYASLTFPALAKVNIMERRRFQFQSDLNEDAIWTTVRNNGTGLGVIWEMPEIEVPDPPAPGPMENLIIRARVICDRNLNNTGLEPETVCKYIRRMVHQWYIADRGQFYAQGKMMQPVNDYPNLLAYEETFKIKLADEWYFRVNQPTLTQNGAGAMVLTNDAATPAAAIVYTLDGSSPGNGADYSGAVNAGAQIYQNPIPVAAGASATIRWAAYLAGYLPSAISQATVSN